MDNSHILAESEIKSALVRERYYRDSKQWAKLRDIYHPDASQTRIDITWYKGNIDGFIQESREMATKGPTVIHNITPVEVDLNGPRAFAVSVGSICARFRQSSYAYDLVSNCRFLSRLQKVERPSGAGWKLLSMEVIYIYDSIFPAAPSGGQGPLVIDDMPPSTRSSYRYLSWLLLQQGREVNLHMPGVDNEESVREVMERNCDWLYDI